MYRDGDILLIKVDANRNLDITFDIRKKKGKMNILSMDTVYYELYRKEKKYGNFLEEELDNLVKSIGGEIVRDEPGWMF